MNRTLRLVSLALAVVVTIGLMATTTAPAHARAQTQAVAHSTHAANTVSSDREAQPRATSSARNGGQLKPFGPHINYVGHDYCGGWLQGPAWCLTFNKVEAGYISAVSLATATAFICAGTALITCGVAAGIAAAIQRYVDRNGVCPNSRPKMRVEYFPRPGRVECV